MVTRLHAKRCRDPGAAAITSEPTGPNAAGARTRWPSVDLARGAAVLAMVVYHSAWDLSQLQLIATEITRVPAWNLFARAIAASFLALVGAGLVLAHPRRVARRAFAIRLATIAGAALAVTAATAVAFPDSYIFFGILHNIALSSVLALPFLRMPAALTAAVGAAVLAAPLVVGHPALDTPALAFLGLGSTAPVTNDFVPVFPWTGFVLVGMAGMRLLRTAAGDGPVRRPAPAGRALAWTGRHSLAIYLLHQPVVFGALWLVLQASGPNPAAGAAPFLRYCEAGCGAAGQATDLCRRSCSCTLEGLRADGAWPRMLRGNASAEDMDRAAEIGRACRARSN